MESFFFGGTASLFDHDDAISPASFSLCIIFISEAHCSDDEKRGGVISFILSLSLVSLALSFAIAVSIQC